MNKFFKLSTVLLLCFCFTFYSQNIFAQSGEGVGEDALPTNTGTGGATGFVNRTQSQDAQPADTQQNNIQNTNTAVTTNSKSGACPYVFREDLYFGVNSPDVKVLQSILNLDKRTAIADSGPGSRGKEVDFFGSSTTAAVKKFQSLFIEYIGIANGRFGPKTRTVMNTICNGEYFDKSANGNSVNKNVYNSPSTATTGNGGKNSEAVKEKDDSIGPSIYLSANINSINEPKPFRLILVGSEPIQPPKPDDIVIYGGGVSEVRKLAPNSYSINILPNEDAKVVEVFIEADKVSDIAGNVNENASNEVKILVKSNASKATASSTATTSLASITATTSELGSLSSLLDKVLASVATTSAAQTQCNPNSTTNYYLASGQYCYASQAAVNQQQNQNRGSGGGSGGGQGGGGMGDLGKMLGGLLGGGGLGGKSGGGDGGGNGGGGGGGRTTGDGPDAAGPGRANVKTDPKTGEPITSQQNLQTQYDKCLQEEPAKCGQIKKALDAETTRAGGELKKAKAEYDKCDTNNANTVGVGAKSADCDIVQDQLSKMCAQTENKDKEECKGIESTVPKKDKEEDKDMPKDGTATEDALKDCKFIQDPQTKKVHGTTGVQIVNLETKTAPKTKYYLYAPGGQLQKKNPSANAGAENYLEIKKTNCAIFKEKSLSKKYDSLICCTDNKCSKKTEIKEKVYELKEKNDFSGENCPAAEAPKKAGNPESLPTNKVDQMQQLNKGIYDWPDTLYNR
jgi:hypothetical protein